jgi:hypothetical protein
MGFYEIIFSFIIAAFFTLFLGYGFKNRGPWNNLWLFFMVLFLGIWASSYWLMPVGPFFWGINWVPLFFAGLLFALLLASAVPPATAKEERKIKAKADTKPGEVAIGGFFILLVIILLIIIITHYF